MRRWSSTALMGSVRLRILAERASTPVVFPVAVKFRVFTAAGREAGAPLPSRAVTRESMAEIAAAVA